MFTPGWGSEPTGVYKPKEPNVLEDPITETDKVTRDGCGSRIKMRVRGFGSDRDILFPGHSCQSMADPESASMCSACAGVTPMPDLSASS